MVKMFGARHLRPSFTISNQTVWNAQVLMRVTLTNVDALSQKRLFHVRYVWEETMFRSQRKRFRDSPTLLIFLRRTAAKLRDWHFYLMKTHEPAEDTGDWHSFAGVNLAQKTHAPYVKVAKQ